jgi:hypothetical protein
MRWKKVLDWMVSIVCCICVLRTTYWDTRQP